MKNVRTSLCAIFGATLIFTTLCSCKNFLNAGKVKEEIEKQIYIANNDCPVPLVEEPVFADEGVAKNKAIIISFSKSMKIDNFDECLTITDSNGVNLKEHFLAPVWSNNNKLVTIPANERNLIDLAGKQTLDIYIKLSRHFETPDELPLTTAINHKYRICNKLDNVPPQLHAVRAELPGSYIGRTSAGGPAILVEGALNAQTEQDICTTNHINSKVDFFVEGSDYGGGYVYGYLQYKRVFDTTGKPVNEPEQTCKELLKTDTENETSTGTFCLDLSNTALSDGMYEVKVFVQDTSNALSEESKVYYVIRDTTLLHSINAAIWFRANYTWEEISDIQQTTKQLYRVQLHNIWDDVFYISNLNKDAQNNYLNYKNTFKDYSYSFIWSTSLDTIDNCTPQKLRTEPDPFQDDKILVFFPDDFINLRHSPDYVGKDLFIKIIFEDPR